MRNFNEDNITAAVIERLAGSTSKRVHQISDALVRHLHAFVKEIEPTEDEWAAAIRFLTQTGQMCTDTRQEFILLSDTLGVSMLVDAINHRYPGDATQTTVLGPFYVEEAAALHAAEAVAAFELSTYRILQSHLARGLRVMPLSVSVTTSTDTPTPSLA